MYKMIMIFMTLIAVSTVSQAQDGKKVFETYCWGCHHQTAVAFGPSFAQIAELRSAEVIRGMITNPDSVSKVLGYTRNAMPAFILTESEMSSIIKYILSYKENNTTKESK